MMTITKNVHETLTAEKYIRHLMAEKTMTITITEMIYADNMKKTHSHESTHKRAMNPHIKDKWKKSICTLIEDSATPESQGQEYNGTPKTADTSRKTSTTYNIVQEREQVVRARSRRISQKPEACHWPNFY